MTECAFQLQEGRIEAQYVTMAEGAVVTRVFSDSKVAIVPLPGSYSHLLLRSDAIKSAALWHAGNQGAGQEEFPDGGYCAR